MSPKEAIVQGYAKPGLPAPEFLVRYIPAITEPLILSVHSAMGQQLHAKHHPRFKHWLEQELQQEKSTTAA